MKHLPIYIVPTLMGLYFIAITFILLMISLFFSHSLAYVTTFLFFSLVCFCAFITNANIKYIYLDSLINRKYHGYEDQQDWHLLIKNYGYKKRYGIFFKKTTHVEKPIHIEPLKTEQLPFKTSLKRGIHEIKSLRPCSSFPFGLFCAWIVEKTNLQFFIAPKRENKTHLSLEDFEHFKTRGEKNAETVQGREEFFDYKEYEKGDPVASIDWKKSYQDNIYVKTYREKSSKDYLIDESIIAKQAKNREEIITSMSYFVELCNQKRIHYAVKIDGQPSPFGEGQRHWANMIERLASL